ncbi:hypothetical protein [Thermococcus gorgonarius]|nr:hypothetical protein [Thermococcus gorgonarius]
MVALSLLPLAGMFIFGGKKRNKKKEEWMKKMGLSKKELEKY